MASPDYFPLTISVPNTLKKWVDRKRAEGFVISRLIVALMLAEYEKEKKEGKIS